MKLRTKTIILAVAFIHLIGRADASQEHEVTLMGGAHRFRNGSDLRDQVILRGAYGRYLGSRHGVEVYGNLAITSGATQPTVGQGGSVEADVLLYGIDYTFYLRPHAYSHQQGHLVPFVSAGIGGFSAFGDNAHSDNTFAMNAGVGMKYILSKRLSFQASFRVYSTDAHQDVEGSHRIRMDALMTGISVKI